MHNPRAYGIDLDDPIPEFLQAALDETPVMYMARCKKTFSVVAPGLRSAESKQVRTKGGDKRCVTGTPVTTRSGLLICMQLIFKGKSTRCCPALQNNTHPAVYTDFSDSKFQTTGV